MTLLLFLQNAKRRYKNGIAAECISEWGDNWVSGATTLEVNSSRATNRRVTKMTGKRLAYQLQQVRQQTSEGQTLRFPSTHIYIYIYIFAFRSLLHGSRVSETNISRSREMNYLSCPRNPTRINMVREFTKVDADMVAKCPRRKQPRKRIQDRRPLTG
jgi:hypothetical protein